MGREGGGFGGGGGFSSGGFGGGGRSSGGFRGGSPRSGSFPVGNSGSSHYRGSGGGLFNSYLLWRLLDGSRRSGASNGGRSPNSGSGGSNVGCLTVAAITIAAVLLVGLLSMLLDAPGCSTETSVTPSTIERAALPENAVIETGYFKDEDGQWIQNSTQLESGMRQFFDATGVQPFLYIVPDKSMDASQAEKFAQEQYPKLFNDQGHFLFVFCYQGLQGGVHGYTYGCYFGFQAKTVMDKEAENIFLDYLDRYINDESISESQAFSEAYAKTADRIMTTEVKRATPAIIVVAASIVIVIVVAVIALIVFRKSRQREQEQRRQQEILNTPLEKFGDKDLEDLEKKYADMDDSASKGADMKCDERTENGRNN